MSGTDSEIAEDLTRLKEAVQDVREWLDLKMTTGRYSFGLVLELARHQIARAYNVHKIYDEIGILEGHDQRPSMTKPAAPFTGEVLTGLWHKHHHQAGFIPRNLSLEMSRPGAMREALAPYFGRYVHEVAGEIAHVMTIAAYERRAGEHRMTGEWLMYEPTATGNYYLTLSTHAGETDEQRRERVDVYREVDARLIAEARQRTGSTGR